MKDTAINRIMTTGPATVGPDDPVATARKLLQSGDIHHLPVVENGKLAGIVSSSDLLKLYLLDDGAAALADEKTTVRQIMEVDPVVLQSSASLRGAATKLSNGGFHALPVIGPDGALMGIVTTSDLVHHLLQQIPRGDGSIRPKPESESRFSDSEISTVLREAEQAAERDGERSSLSQVLLYFRDRNRLLQNACHAAGLYIRSGHGAREHSQLVQRLADLQKSGDSSKS